MHTTDSRQFAFRIASCALAAIAALTGCSQPVGGEDGTVGNPLAAPGGTDQPTTQVVAIDFDAATPGYIAEDFSAAGTARDPLTGFLDADSWEILGFSDGDLTYGGEADSGDFARGTNTGGASTGGLYAFEVGVDDHALGVQPTASDFAPGSISLRIPVTITAPALVSIGYALWVYNDEDRSTRWTCQVSGDATTWQTLDDLTAATSGPAGEAAWVRLDLSSQLDITGLVSDGTLYIRWSAEDESGSGGRDETAIDDITITIES